MEIFNKYFTATVKISIGKYSQWFSFQCGIFRIEIEETFGIGSRGYIAVGTRTVFVTPNEQGISFEDCCIAIAQFLKEQSQLINESVK